MTDSDPILFLPGPVEVDAELRAIMSMPLIGHRSAAFKECTLRLAPKLGRLFCKEGPAFFENAPGTALMEAGIRNLVKRKVLHLVGGSFGQRWHKTSVACGREAHAIESEWGTAADPSQLRSKLAQHRDDPFEAVCITHNETSTGVLNPLAKLAATVREASPDTLVLVDAVTSVGGAELQFDDWGIDLAFAGTQKCLALPPGLCVFAVSQRALAKAETVEGRGFLFDFVAAPGRFEKGAPPATPCIPLAFALDRQLDRILDEEGLEARWNRHLQLRDRTTAWAEQHGFTPFVDNPAHRSPTVSALHNGPLQGGTIVARAAEAGFTLGRGYGSLKETTFRIGHMGDHPIARLEALLQGIAAD